MTKNKNISLITSVAQAEGNIVSDMDGEKVMLSVQNGKYYNLGEIGGEIWDLIEIPVVVNELVDKLLATYEVEQKDCEIQVMSLLEQLFDENLIKIDE